ncbi:FAD-dependent monooxygenase [Streptomyces sp. WAC 04229]|uniref:FAD-dependent monooxygenase n=1 Tax=Streptomyces sp. WAC 04229 TaxID=2203206 RepID=UPI003D7548B6
MELTGFDADDETVTVRTGHGAIRAGWLVGCDGGRSTVRKLAGFEFSRYGTGDHLPPGSRGDDRRRGPEDRLDRHGHRGVRLRADARPRRHRGVRRSAGRPGRAGHHRGPSRHGCAVC